MGTQRKYQENGMKAMNRTLLVTITCLLVFFNACKNSNHGTAPEPKPTIPEVPDTVTIMPNQKSTLAKAVFYFENSESMFGYVNGLTEYVEVVSELAEKPRFAEEKTPCEFFLVNGGNKLQINPLGNNPAVLKKQLSRTGFRKGDVTKSNLNSMFQLALNKARRDTISILISDAIYDIGKPNAPLNALATEGKETRSRFIGRLGQGDLQTIMIKLHSHFDGYYFPVSGGKLKMKQERPYYIWIFGESKLLNDYFPEDYIKSLKGYSDFVRFLKLKETKVPFQVTSIERKGSFKVTARQGKNNLTKAKVDRNGGGFQFTVGVDFSSLPFSTSYFNSKSNYECSCGYEVVKVSEVDKKIHEIDSFTPTHLITVRNSKSPYCKLKVLLINQVPDWINTTSIDEENNILGDAEHTFGFRFLTGAIDQAYSHINKGKSIADFHFHIAK